MGEPDDRDQFVRFQADDLALYVARRLLEALEEGATRMPFYITGYGRFWIEFSQAWSQSVECDG
jgi:hypothetical protein